MLLTALSVCFCLPSLISPLVFLYLLQSLLEWKKFAVFVALLLLKNPS